ncbi:hypothetical protein A1F97_10054 [Pyrenophora tritici-repentis]|nr:hypothetical protein A1F97_10054 [Pyrenophora tritici-repentis]
MDAASTDSPSGHDTQNRVANPAHGPFDDTLKNSANGEPAVQDNATDTMSNPPLSDNGTLEKEPDMGEQKELVVKLKFKTDNAPILPSEIANMGPGSATMDPAQESASLDSSRLSAEDTSIKLEPEDIGNITAQDLNSSGTHKIQGDESSDTTLTQQPLNEHMNESHQTNTPQDKTVPEEHPVSGNNGVCHGSTVAELQTSHTADPKEDHQLPIKVDDGEQAGGEHDETDRLLPDTPSVPDNIPAPGRDVNKLKDEDMDIDKEQVSTLQSQRLGVSQSIAESTVDGIFGQSHKLDTTPIQFTIDSTSPLLGTQNITKKPPVANSLSSYSKSVSGRQTPQPASHPGHQRSQSYMPPAFASRPPPSSYQRGHPPSAFQPFAYGNNSGPSAYIMATPSPYGQMMSMSSQLGRGPGDYSMAALRDVIDGNPGPSAHRYTKAPPQVVNEDDRGQMMSMSSQPNYNMAALRDMVKGKSGPSAQRYTKARSQVFDENEEDKDDEYSDDDEPLRTRVKRHPSVMSEDSVIHMSSPPLTSIRDPHNDRSASSFLTDKETPEPDSSSAHKNPVRKPRPLPQPLRPDTSLNGNEDIDSTKINWCLPRYEVLPQPTLDDVPSAKISLPGLVREELLLSPDHSAQETHLLLNLFLPGQQALAEPDPQPAVALLNFHTIAVMVIECYVQYEIGDELGLGRGHFHDNHDDEGIGEYERVRDAKDADVDEIFFAVVDRWRAGRESKKESLTLIRGAQEFADQALDVIYYIKENGLLRGTEGKGKKKVRTEEEMVGGEAGCG